MDYARLYKSCYEKLKIAMGIICGLLVLNICLSVAIIGMLLPSEEEQIDISTPVVEAVEIVEEPEKPEVYIDPNELDLLACVIYREAGGDASCDDCRRMVADVVLNRVNDPRFPNSIEAVLIQPGQYGNFSETGVQWPERSKNPGEQEAVARAYRIAGEVLSGEHSPLYGAGYIWQATFRQGINHVYCHGTYFGR